MADHLVIKKDGLYAYHWNSKARAAAKARGENIKDESAFYDECKAATRKIWSHLRETCSIDEGVTLGDIFRMVESYPKLEAFLKQYSWCKPIRKFHEQAKLPKDVGEHSEKIHYISITHYGEVHDHYGDTTIDIYEDLAGMGNPDPESECKDAVGYGLSLTPMYEIAHLPVKLDETLNVTRWSKKKGIETLIESTRGFTLLEILDAIYWDISFYGGPAERENFIKDTNADLAKLKIEATEDNA